jgi:hypothetical protein
VVYKNGWGFRLPAQHSVRLSSDGKFVSLDMPQRGSTHFLERIEETDDEYRIYVGGFVMGHAVGDLETRYPFPQRDEELHRLGEDIVKAGGDRSEVTAWAQGASNDSQTAAARKKLRELRGS